MAYTKIDLSKYSGGYKATDREKKAEQQKIQAENAVTNYGDFVYSNQGAYDTLMDSILNRKKFSYDMNADALYQQYKNQYTALGKLAMQDTIGQASALTGGYGNSYATSAGSQAYQNYLQQLNERVPELMQLALSTYNAEGDRLYNNMSLMQSDRNTEYGTWADKYNRLLGDRTYYGDNYNTVHSQDYAAWADNRSYDQTQYWNEYNAGYQADRDAVADSQWQQQFDYQKERDEVADSQWQQSYDLSVKQSDAKKSKTDTIPDSVYAKLDTFQTNEEIGAYLNSLAASGVITREQAKSLYAQYRRAYDSKDASKSYYSVIDDGKTNWFGGVDGNAVIMDAAGNKYSGDELVAKLVEQGYTKKEAREIVKKIQKDLGIG